MGDGQPMLVLLLGLLTGGSATSLIVAFSNRRRIKSEVGLNEALTESAEATAGVQLAEAAKKAGEMWRELIQSTVDAHTREMLLTTERIERLESKLEEAYDAVRECEAHRETDAAERHVIMEELRALRARTRSTD